MMEVQVALEAHSRGVGGAESLLLQLEGTAYARRFGEQFQRRPAVAFEPLAVGLFKQRLPATFGGQLLAGIEFGVLAGEFGVLAVHLCLALLQLDPGETFPPFAVRPRTTFPIDPQP